VVNDQLLLFGHQSSELNRVVLKEDFRLFLDHFRFGFLTVKPLATACPNVAEYSKAKPPRTRCFTARHPCPGRRACSTVAFIHQDKVLAFKGFNGNGLVAHFVAQLVDVDDLNRALEDPTAILVKQLAEAKAGKIQFVQMLTRQAFIRREQDDLVGKGFPLPLWK
jgi:hypothetical protein